MKKYSLVLIALFIFSATSAQKKEKIKGSKFVSVTQRKMEEFNTLEVEDNLEVFLVKGEIAGIEIEADDNVHDAIQADLNASTLRLYTSKQIVRTKQLSVRVTYTENLQSITTHNEVILNALANLEVSNISIKNLDDSQSFLNIRVDSFTFAMDDKSHAEINVKAENTIIELSKNAELKALIASPTTKIDMYQKTEAEIEGDTDNLLLRIDNEAAYTGEKFTAKNLQLTAEAFTSCSINAKDNVTVSASGEAEIELYGSPAAINITKFTNTATLHKKDL
ncbi:GIN domain-containing protein [Flavobacterium rhizosphaerae]|uniref:DUF2807 domain-containing protein n=1 Tax=Flavobacterium rhizosphaerae TaxID=3163298 RepID=A0ABW8YXB9_9FLAO